MSNEIAATLAAHSDLLFALQDFAEQTKKNLLDVTQQMQQNIEQISSINKKLLNVIQSILDTNQENVKIQQQLANNNQIFRLFMSFLILEEVVDQEKFITYIKNFVKYSEENGIKGLNFLADYISELEAS